MSYVIFSEVTISLDQLLSMLLSFAGIVALVFLALLFYRMAAALKKVKDMLDEMALPLTQTVNQLPEIVKKTDQSLADVNVITESAAKNIPDILDEVTNVTGSVGATVETVADTTTNIVGTVNKLFSLGKKNRDKKATSGINFAGIVSKFKRVIGIISFLRKFKRKRQKSKSEKSKNKS
ncbi:MAG TPA: DUF948 domain-containing protein [Clostridiaceae bacterium]|nr:DUF948 domain-containing protein [Clostridiaceae bacterium]